MKVTIKQFEEKKLIGVRKVMSISANTTHELWKGFMPRLAEIENKIGGDLFSIQNYPPLYFSAFDPALEFEKWAAVEVADFEKVPDTMERFRLRGGLYAVFDYKGAASAAAGAFQYIFSEWLPNSNYLLDDRPHFEVLGEKYKNDDPGSEEEIWIPIME